MIVLFKISAEKKPGHETVETKLEKLKDYKKLLEKDGRKIVSEKEVTSRRGTFKKIEYK